MTSAQENLARFWTEPYDEVDSAPEAKAPIARSKPRLRAQLLDICLLVPLLLFICFYHLNGQSLHHVDETTHVRVTQEMLMTGDWWHPQVFGKPYYNKPPFKMWLTAIPVSLLGESNFSYRFVDGLCGVGTALLIYFFALQLFSSRLIGIFSVVALMSARSYVFVHGIRTSTQDSMLLFLLTGAMICGYYVLERIREGSARVVGGTSNSPMGFAVLGGVCIGLSVLTKNVAGFLPLAMIGVYAILAGDIPRLIRSGKGAIATTIVLAFLLPGLYIVPRVLFDPNLITVMFGDEVVHRVTEGYHNRASTWFYFKRLFRYRAGIPPELIYAGFAVAFFGLWRRWDRRFLFLAVWGALPVLLFTAVPSRLTWYMAPAFPGMALLGGVAIGYALRMFAISLQRFESRSITSWFAVGSLSLLLWAFSFGLWKNYQFVSDKILHPIRGRLPFDMITEEILAQQQQTPAKKLKTVVFGEPTFGRNELVYIDMHPQVIRVSKLEELARVISEEKPNYLFAASNDFRKVAAIAPFQGYRFLPPANHRPNWAVMLQYDDVGAKSMFTPVRRAIDFGDAKNTAQFLYGWSDSLNARGVTVRHTRGMMSAILVNADRALASLGTKLDLNLGYSAKAGLPRADIQVALNGETLGVIAAPKRGLEKYSFTVPPGKWLAGNNVISFNYKTSDGSVLPPSTELFTFNWAVVSLNQSALGLGSEPVQ